MVRDESFNVLAPTPWGHHAVPLSEEMHEWLNERHGLNDPLYAELEAETAAMPDDAATGLPVWGFGVPRMQGATLAWLIRAFGFENVIELGMFTGMSALMMAQALPPHGRLTTCEIDPAPARIARKYFKRAGVEGKINIEMRPAAQVLLEMAEGGARVDFAFVDADKLPTHRYFDLILDVMDEGGVIAIDNVLFLGDILNEDSPRGEAAVMDRFTRLALQDERVNPLLLPVFDGLLLAQKR